MSVDPAGYELAGIFDGARLDPFLHHSQGDLAKAKRAYIWNASLAARYIARTGFVEVGLRNILDESLVKLTGSDRWWDDFYDRLAPLSQRSIDKTLRQRVFDDWYPRDRFIAKTEFGLWTSLLHHDNARSLTQLANHAFEAKRGAVYHLMNDVRRLRNRAAHHACLIDEDHSKNVDSINKALGYIDENLAVFVNQADDLERVLASYNSFLAGNCHL